MSLKLQDITNHQTSLKKETKDIKSSMMTTVTTKSSAMMSASSEDNAMASMASNASVTTVTNASATPVTTAAVSAPAAAVTTNTTKTEEKGIISSNVRGAEAIKITKNNKIKQNGKQKKKKNNNNSNNTKEKPFLDETEKDIDLIGTPDWIVNLMQVQPTLNIMTIGDVSHGKSTLMWGLCDEKTGRDSRELKRNMTIKLGYTSCKIFKCVNCQLSNNICYFSGKSTINIKQVRCPKCNVKSPFVVLVRHISFVDCPGHAEYMGTMISAACVADGAIMVIDASRTFPGKQTVQHMSAAHLLGVLTKNLEEKKIENESDLNSDDIEFKEGYDDINTISGISGISGIDGVNNGVNCDAINDNDRIKVIVAQNKIDLITKSQACKNVGEIRQFLRKYDRNLSSNTPIIPISAQSRLNLDALCMTIVQKYPPFSPRLKLLSNEVYKSKIYRNPSVKPTENNISHNNNSLQINIIRSFDVNRPCVLRSIEDIDKKLRGGVVGGVIINGTISVGDTVCIRPGILKLRANVGVNKNTRRKPNKILDKVDKLLVSRFEYQAIEAKVIGLKCGTKSLTTAYPGANVGVMLNIDPCLTKSDERAGDIVCNPTEYDRSKLPVFNVFKMSFVLLKPFENIEFNVLEGVKVNIGSSKVNGQIVKKRFALPDKRSDGIMIVLERPICAKVSSKVTLTRKINGEWRLAAGGIIFSVRECVPSRR